MNRGYRAHLEQYEGRTPNTTTKPTLRNVVKTTPVSTNETTLFSGIPYRFSAAARPQSHYETSLRTQGISTKGMASKSVRALFEGIQVAEKTQSGELPHAARDILLQGGAGADSYYAALAIGIRNYAVPEGFARSSE
jgi:hypothetical protein